MVTMLLSLVAFAQPPQPPRFNPAKFEADMEQFITTEVGLTPMEASRFFPLFREMQNKQRALFGKMRFYAHTDTSNDAASLKTINKVLSPGKVLAVIKAEEKFHRQAFKRMARRKTR